MLISPMQRVLGFLRYYSTVIIVLLPPLILLPLPLLVDGQESQAGYMLILMVIYWCTEILPLSVTALIPVFLMPLFGLADAKDLTSNYLENTTLLLIGGLIIAIGVENCNLHRRIAINFVMRIGASPRWLVFGFMLPTWILSMWISNTATTAMMLPIVEEVLKSLDLMQEEKETASSVEDAEPKGSMASHSTTVFTIDDSNDNVMMSLEPKDVGTSSISFSSDSASLEMYSEAGNESEVSIESGERIKESPTAHLGRALVISVAFAANCGGVATLIGTPVNPIFKGQADEIWEGYGCESSPITFVSWMLMGFPVSFLNLLVIWIWLELFFVGFKGFCGKEDISQAQEKQIIQDILKREHSKLGPMSTAEIQTCIIFVFFVLVLFFRDPGFMPGWDSLVAGKTSDATPAIFFAVLLFVIPEHYEKYSDKKAESLVTWKSMKEKFTWDIIFLLGGGYALADAVMKSKLSELIGNQLLVLQDLPGPILVIILGIFITIVTQFTSNTAAAAIFFPITAAMAEKMGKSPLYLMFPVAICVQFAFMLPVATPPNAIAFSTGRITVLDMVKSGAFLNVACVIVMTLGLFTWGDAYFDFNSLPWEQCNSTVVL